MRELATDPGQESLDDKDETEGERFESAKKCLIFRWISERSELLLALFRLGKIRIFGHFSKIVHGVKYLSLNSSIWLR